jgi:hypothetical protein
MAGDNTRMTFKPRKDYAGVLMQQGRVTLDADWNELVEALDRRLRAEIVDTIGRCVYSRETPDAFHIALSGGNLTIGRGRAYVHGLLVENHGADPTEYDPVLGEVRGTQPVDYDKQPYLPNAAAVAPLPTSGTFVAYVDAWQREVTYLEDPDLVEKAIAVDTSTRLQSAWQVRLLEAPDGTTCDSDLPGWDALTAPSAGRLTSAGVGVPAPTDPCTIPASGGYRGTENRLYRVEIHDAGPLGTATFKWSRDNASVASHVDTIDASRTELTLTRLGRDGVQRIRVDDWVEVLDDWLELNGLPGELRKVAAVDEVTQSITVAPALPSGKFDATDPTRHTRVTRWDQAGVAVDAAGGVVTVPATPASPIVLEDGVQVSFDVDPSGGDFHVGDYWVFAARTADASVEELVDEPPRGIKRHFCRLAVVTFPDSVVDCRQPPSQPDGEACCDCTVCVTPESHATGTLTIQDAVNMVSSTGGKICLDVGIYRLDEPVRIKGARSIELQGKGWKTILVNAGRGPAIWVETSLGVTIDRLAIVTSSLARRGAAPLGIAILLRNTIGTIIERCVLLQLGLLQTEPPGDQPPPPGTPPPQPIDPCPPDDIKAVIARAAVVDFGRMFGPKGAGAPLIALDGIVLETLIQENILVGTIGIGSLWGDLYGKLDVKRPMDLGVDTRVKSSEAVAIEPTGYLLTFDLAIEDNLFLCWLTGVSLEGFSLQLSETRISANSLLVCLRGAIVTTGVAGPGGRVDIRNNLVRGLGYGIVSGTDDARVVDNDVGRLRGLGANRREGSLTGLSAMFETGAAGPAFLAAFLTGDGILLAPSLRPAGIDRCQVRGNRVIDVVGNGIAIRTLVQSALIADNMVQQIGGGGVIMDGRASGRLVAVERNQVLDVGLLQNERTDGVAGIQLGRCRDVSIVGNEVDGVGLSSPLARFRFGIAAAGCQGVRITGNTVADVAPADDFVGLSAGILVVDPFQRADVLDNSVRRADTGPSGQPRSEWFGILIAGVKEFAEPLAGTVVLIAGDQMFSFFAQAGRAFEFPRGRGSLAVRGNLVEAYGEAPAVRIETDAPCLFNDNRCFLEAREGSTTAFVEAGAAVTSNNYLDGPVKGRALDLRVAAGPFTLLGNIATGGIFVNNAPLPPTSQWAPLNIP